MPALGRRDAGAVGHNVGHGLIAGMADPGPDRFGRAGDGTGDHLGVEGGEIRLRSPASDQDHQITVGAAQRRDRRGHGGRRVAALHGDRHHLDVEAESRPSELAQEVPVSLGPGTGHQSHPQRHLGHRSAALRRSRPSASSVRRSCARCAANRPSSAVTSSSERMKPISPFGR